jgi:hypothetical protein
VLAGLGLLPGAFLLVLCPSTNGERCVFGCALFSPI